MWTDHHGLRPFRCIRAIDSNFCPSATSLHTHRLGHGHHTFLHLSATLFRKDLKKIPSLIALPHKLPNRPIHKSLPLPVQRPMRIPSTTLFKNLKQRPPSFARLYQLPISNPRSKRRRRPFNPRVSLHEQFIHRTRRVVVTLTSRHADSTMAHLEQVGRLVTPGC